MFKIKLNKNYKTRPIKKRPYYLYNDNAADDTCNGAIIKTIEDCNVVTNNNHTPTSSKQLDCKDEPRDDCKRHTIYIPILFARISYAYTYTYIYMIWILISIYR